MATSYAAVPVALLELGVLLVSWLWAFVAGLLEFFCWTHRPPVSNTIPSPLATSLPLVVKFHLSRYLSRQDRHNMAAVFPSWRPFIDAFDAQLPEHTPESRDKQERRWILYLTTISRVHGFTFKILKSRVILMVFIAGYILLILFHWLTLLDAYEYELLLWRFMALVCVASWLTCFFEDTYVTLLLSHPMELLAHDPNLAPGANLQMFFFYMDLHNVPDVAFLSEWQISVKYSLICFSLTFFLCIVILLWHISFTH